MKTKILGVNGRDSEEIELPAVFDTPYRPDVIHKVYVNVLSHTYQRQGRYPAAGEMVSAESRNTGLGIARLARARGEGFPRVAHPPESWKITYKKINYKEKKLGLCSAIAATSQKDLVQRRGHKIAIGTKLPLVVSNDIESISKTKELKNLLIRLGLGEDIVRAASVRKARSGTARRRLQPCVSISVHTWCRRQACQRCRHPRLGARLQAHKTNSFLARCN
jgi:large subunit ribosomal protein L4e